MQVTEEARIKLTCMANQHGSLGMGFFCVIVVGMDGFTNEFLYPTCSVNCECTMGKKEHTKQCSSWKTAIIP